MNRAGPILQLMDVSINFGGVQAIDRLSFQVDEGQIFSIIGPNGAGKTTAINLITGIYPPTHGEIFFQGKTLVRKKSYQVAYLGIARTFQNIQVFHNMSIRENVMVGMHTKSHTEFLRCLLHTPKVLREEKEIGLWSEEVLQFMGFSLKADQPASGLPYGDQKRLEIARTLAMKPRLLLLDEPVAGLNLKETEEMSQTILKIRDTGITVILVEHDMNLVMGISDTITVLNYGVKIAEGSPIEIQNNPEVIKAYLGEEF